MITPRGVIHAALRHQGAPYLWKGKGLHLWTPSGLQGNGLDGVWAFDCSGLVTVALHDAGGPDWRAAHNADSLYRLLEPEQNPNAWGCLRFYGTLTRATHIAIALGNELVLEAGGGDQRTTSLELARRQGARVRVVFDTRKDLLGARKLPLSPPVRS